jgi:hypothetical protein
MGLTGWRSWNNWTFEENFQGSLSRSEGPDGLRKWIHDLLCENRGTAETVEWKSSVYTIPLYGRSHTGPSLVAFPASTVTSGGGKSFRRAIDACVNNTLFGRGDFGAPTRREEGA